MIRNALSHVTSNLPGLFYFLKKVDLLLHFVLRKQFEPDFKVFQKIAGVLPELQVVDVGANIGQSALGFGVLFPKASILSFEANPDLAGYLKFCSRLLGDRFAFRLQGLSDAKRSVDLFIPRRGKVLIFGEASVDRAILNDPAVAARIGTFEVAQRTIDLVDFDSLELAPDLVKIDVQGHELSVLAGMKKTIETAAPIFLLERSSADADVIGFLEPYGYAFYVSAPAESLKPYAADVSSTNVFCLPAGSGARSRLVGLLLGR